MEAAYRALEGEEEVILVDFDGFETNGFHGILEEYSDSMVELEPGYGSSDLTGLDIHLSEKLEEAVELDRDADYLLTVDPVGLYKLRNEETAYRFLEVVSGRFRDANSRCENSDFQALFMTDSEAYGAREWSQLRNLADARLDLEDGSYSII